MADTLRTIVILGGPILIAAAVIYGLLAHRPPANRHYAPRKKKPGRQSGPGNT